MTPPPAQAAAPAHPVHLNVWRVKRLQHVESVSVVSRHNGSVELNAATRVSSAAIRPLPCILLPPERVYAVVRAGDGRGQAWKGWGWREGIWSFLH